MLLFYFIWSISWRAPECIVLHVARNPTYYRLAMLSSYDFQQNTDNRLSNDGSCAVLQPIAQSPSFHVLLRVALVRAPRNLACLMSHLANAESTHRARGALSREKERVCAMRERLVT